MMVSPGMGSSVRRALYSSIRDHGYHAAVKPPGFCLRCGASLGDKEDGGRIRKACTANGCGYVFYGNPTPVVAALVERGGDVLLVHQRGWPDGWWGLVTGFLEAGETPEAGCLRELKEELGMDGTIVGLIGVYAFEMRNELIVAYHVKAEGAPTIGEELDAVKAVPVEKLRPWPMGTGMAVRDFLARRSENAVGR
jgi:NADH pyrophosphatase NudC (nudix superfamily)